MKTVLICLAVIAVSKIVFKISKYALDILTEWM